jgi:hypothetical protein
MARFCVYFLAARVKAGSASFLSKKAFPRTPFLDNFRVAEHPGVCQTTQDVAS